MPRHALICQGVSPLVALDVQLRDGAILQVGVPLGVVWVLWVIQVPRNPLAFEETRCSASEECGDGSPDVSIGARLQVELEVIEDAIESVDHGKAVALDDSWESSRADYLQQRPGFSFVRGLD